LTAAVDSAAGRFGGIDVLHYSSPGAGTTETLRSTGALDVTVDNLRPQIECICYGAITATRAVLPAMLAAGARTLLYTTGASSVTPAPVFVSLKHGRRGPTQMGPHLNGALAARGVYAYHVAIGTWIAGTPGAPEGAPLKEPDDIARLYRDLPPAVSPPNTSSPPDPAVHMATMTVPTASGEKDAHKDHRLNRNQQGSARRSGTARGLAAAAAGLADR
jgi:NAD(P)-dependent dehydrogenase (short-subunit alcohol dehydrogenase family)